MISAIDRLNSLPDVFTGTDVMRACSWDSKRTNEMLARWKKRGWVGTLGKRLDVYSNNIKLTEDVRLACMLNKWDANALDLSHSVWSAAGWTTQFSLRSIVASTRIVRDVETDDVYLKYRPLRWWKTVYPGIVHKTEPLDLHKLKPEWLLAEALYSGDKDLWLPDPDDLDFYEIEESTQLTDWNKAFIAMAAYHNKQYEPSANIEDSYMNAWSKFKGYNPTYSGPDC